MREATAEIGWLCAGGMPRAFNDEGCVNTLPMLQDWQLPQASSAIEPFKQGVLHG